MTSSPCANRGRGRQLGAEPAWPRVRHSAAYANPPRTTTTRTRAARELPGEVREAAVALRGSGRCRGRAPHRGGHVRVVERQAVVGSFRRGLVGEPGPVEGAEQPVAGPVAGEHPPRPVPAVRGGGEPDQQDRARRGRRTRGRGEPSRCRHGTRPVSSWRRSRARPRAGDRPDTATTSAADRGERRGTPADGIAVSCPAVRLLLIVNPTASSMTPRRRLRDPARARVSPPPRGRRDDRPGPRHPAGSRRGPGGLRRRRRRRR